MTFNAVAGTTYWFVIDGFGTADQGAFRLNVQ